MGLRLSNDKERLRLALFWVWLGLVLVLLGDYVLGAVWLASSLSFALELEPKPEDVPEGALRGQPR